jgi:hypothetical protein
MRGDLKILIGSLAFTVFLIIGFVLVSSRSIASDEALSNQPVEGVAAEPGYYNLGDVPIKGGIVTKEYKLINTTDKVIKLKKVTTSCMCTKAKIKVGDKETKFFGMEGHGDKNPPVNLEITPNQEILVTVNFDPAAHGPQGVGPFDRSVFLNFSDPAGVKELKFSGKVVS